MPRSFHFGVRVQVFGLVEYFELLNLVTMTTNVQQGTLLDVLKKKMRQTKEEMEKYKDECEEYHKRLQVEVRRREEVSTAII